MKAELVPLRNDRPVTLQTYLADPSPELSLDPRPGVIICPGGAFLFTSDREAEPVALRFLAAGYQAFVLRYTTANMGVTKVYPDVLHDLARTVLAIRERSQEWHVDPQRIAVVGFSAGGALAAMYSTHWHRPELYQAVGASPEALRPTAVILAYPGVDYETMYEIFSRKGGAPAEMFLKSTSVCTGSTDVRPEDLEAISAISYVDEHTVPTFIWITADDEYVPVESVITYAQALAREGIPFEFHVFEEGGHGLSLADHSTAKIKEQIHPHVARWVDLALEWLGRRMERV